MDEPSALYYVDGRLVPAPTFQPRLRLLDGTVLGGNLLGIAGGGCVVLYLPLAECGEGVAERHRAAVLAHLGRCNACAQPLDGHTEEDSAACAAILRQIAEDEAAEVHRG